MGLDVPRRRPGHPGSGAAGGTGFGLLAWGGTIALGGEAVAEVLDLADRVLHADLVVTGEGRFDGQTAGGKVVAVVQALAAAARRPVALVAGRSPWTRVGSRTPWRSPT